MGRNNVRMYGDGDDTIFFGHGFGCDQTMWRFLAPRFGDRYRIVLFDHVGSGGSDKAAYAREKYDSLHGYAEDVVELVQALGRGRTIFVGHSVGASIGLLADLKAPARFDAQVMIGPSPCFINDGDYVGGFTRGDIDSLLETVDANYLGWASNMAPVIMGAPAQPALSEELTQSFSRADPAIAKHFARVTFLADHRAEVPQLTTPTLIIQCSEDAIAPVSVGRYLERTLPRATLKVVDNIGHCPHLSAPSQSAEAMDAFLSARRNRWS